MWRGILRRGLQAAAVLLSLVLGALTAGWIYTAGSDEDPPADGDLARRTRVVPGAIDPFRLLVASSPPILPWEGDPENRNLYEKLLAGATWDPAIAGTIIEKNRAFLDGFGAILAGLEDLRLPPLTGILENGHYGSGLSHGPSVFLLQARAIFCAGREKEGLDRMVRLARFGGSLERAGGLPKQNRFGLTIRRLALGAIRAAAPRSEIPPDELLQVERALRACRSDPMALAETYRARYALISSEVTEIAEGRLSISESILSLGPDPLRDFLFRRGRYFKPNRTRRLAAEAIRAVISDIGKPEAERRTFEYDEPDPWVVRYTEDWVGEAILGSGVNSLPRLETGRVLSDADLAATRAVLALRAFQRRHGRIPAALSELVPECLDEVPLDPFDGKPLRYSPERRILWSVGADRQDAGGAAMGEDGERELPEESEPTFPIGS